MLSFFAAEVASMKKHAIVEARNRPVSLDDNDFCKFYRTPFYSVSRIECPCLHSVVSRCPGLCTL